MSAQEAQEEAPAPTENPVSICACRLAGIFVAPQTLFKTKKIDLKHPGRFVKELRTAVEDATHRSLTVRPASPMLFTEQWFWLHLAVGPYTSFSPDAKVVTEHNSDHTLYGAYGKVEATLVVANKAPAELVEKRQAAEAEQYRRLMAEEAALVMLQKRLPQILEALQSQAQQHTDNLARADAQAKLTKLSKAKPAAVTLLQLVTVCGLLEVEPADLIADAFR